MKKAITILTLIFYFAGSSWAQYYETGAEPFSLNWRQISKNNIRLIFRSEIEPLAYEYLTLLSLSDSLVGTDYNLGSTKIDVILHDRSVLSNGFVAWAPRRMELITYPSADNYSQLWAYQLALHETRHVKQMYSLHKNIPKFAYYFFGQQAIGLAAGFVPQWFFEGDAVSTETAYSFSGRGRSATFYQDYRAYFLSNNKLFTYDKWLLGSYKDFIPNHYNLGYQIVEYGNIKYGNKLWVNTMDYVTRKPFTVFPFYFGIKKQTGLSRKKLTLAAFNYQDSIWVHDDLSKNNLYTKTQILSKNKNSYSNYLYPYSPNNEQILAYKTSLNDVPAFVLLDLSKNNEKIIFHPGYLVGKPSYNDTSIIWAEYKSNYRWDYENYSQIVSYNYQTNQRKVYNLKGRFFSPIINNSDRSIFCLSYNIDGSYRIVSIDKNTNIKELFLFPAQYEPQELIIDDATGNIYILVVTSLGKEIVKINQSKEIELVIGPTYNDLNSIFYWNNNIFFTATVGYKECILSYNLLNNNTYSIINSQLGSKYLYINNTSKIVFSEFTQLGYSISKTDSLIFSDVINLPDHLENNYTTSKYNLEKTKIDTLKIENIKYSSKPYKEFGSLFSFHSWAPFYFNPYNTLAEDYSVKPGITLVSQNLKGNTVAILGYGYGNSHLFEANLKYYGLLPVFSFNFNLYDENAILYAINGYSYNPNKKRTQLKLYSYIPITLSNGYYSFYIQPYTSLERTNDYLFSTSDNYYHSGLFSMNNGLYLQLTRSMAHRDLLPRFGFTLQYNWVSAPLNTENLGTLNAINFNLFLPGFSHNHSIKLSSAFQHQDLKRYYFANKIEFPRGYANYISENFSKYTFDYLFPLFYPDWALGSILYTKRISIDLFYDYALNSYPVISNNQIVEYNTTLKSTGFEIYVDFHVFRTRYPFRLKFQQVFTGTQFNSFTNLSLSIDLYGNFKYANFTKNK